MAAPTPLAEKFPAFRGLTQSDGLEAPRFARARTLRPPAEAVPWRSHDVVANGYMPLARSLEGMFQLWINVLQQFPAKVAAALGQSRINHSAYERRSHTLTSWGLYTKWYPVCMKANTMLDVRFKVMTPGGVPSGFPSRPSGVQMRSMPRWKYAWKIPRYPTAPRQVTPSDSRK